MKLLGNVPYRSRHHSLVCIQRSLDRCSLEGLTDGCSLEGLTDGCSLEGLTDGCSLEGLTDGWVVNSKGREIPLDQEACDLTGAT